MARTRGHGNPKWSRDETILALNLYFELGGAVPSAASPAVQELSGFLRQLPDHLPTKRRDSFRNPDGVAFKLQNLRAVATGKGLQNASATDRAVWAELGADPQRVSKLARLIRDNTDLWKPPPTVEDEADGEEFAEGRVATRLHRLRERDAKVRRHLLASRRRLGQVRCDMCEEPSPCVRSDLEDAAFETHHLLPLASGAERLTRLADVALLCATCHRVLHRAICLERRWVGIAEGRTLLEASNPHESRGRV